VRRSGTPSSTRAETGYNRRRCSHRTSSSTARGGRTTTR
jgi:hypothetical protein